MAYLDTVMTERLPPDLDGSQTAFELPMRVLLVEDETLVAMSIEDMLEENGCAIEFVAASVPQALSWLAHRPAVDAAVLDVNLFGTPVFPVADLLVSRRIPFVFSTAYGQSLLGERYPGVRVLAKPYATTALATALAACKARRLDA
jgi:CheY-like chemotaxis protein